MKPLIILSILLLLGCKSAQESPEAQAKAQQQLNQIEAWIHNEGISIVSDWALPQGSSQINILGNSNELTLKTDSTTAYLPFFGRRYTGGGYNNNVGIAFNGQPKNLQINRDNTKNQLLIHFTIKDDSENYQIYIRLFSNYNSSVDVSSSQRSYMSYTGKVAALKSKE
jgi:hypothetical protein